jgi:hypothetical protein
VANTLKLHRQGPVGFIDWLDALLSIKFSEVSLLRAQAQTMQSENPGAAYEEQDTGNKEP